MAEKFNNFITGKDGPFLAGIAEGNAEDGKNYLAHLIDELNNCRPLTSWSSRYLAGCLQKVLDNQSSDPHTVKCNDPFTLKSTAREAKGYPHSEIERAAFACVSYFRSDKGGNLTIPKAAEAAKTKLLEDYGYDHITEDTIEQYYKKVRKNPPDYTKPHPYKYNEK